MQNLCVTSLLFLSSLRFSLTKCMGLWQGVRPGVRLTQAQLSALRPLHALPCLAKPSTPLSQLPPATKAASVAKGSPKALEFTVNYISVIAQMFYPRSGGGVRVGWGGCGNYETEERGNSQGFFLSEKGFGSGGRNMGRSKGKTREGGFLEKTVCSCCWKG